MANEKRLIDANELKEHHTVLWDEALGFCACVLVEDIDNAPTVDAVPVDEIRVDFMSLSLENQEAVLNVSICGKPNEVKLPFSKEVAEVVHGRWNRKQIGKYTGADEVVCSCCGYFIAVVCSDTGFKEAIKGMNYCPNCGAKMDGDGNG